MWRHTLYIDLDFGVDAGKEPFVPKIATVVSNFND